MKDDEVQVNTLMYMMRDETNNILHSFNLFEEECKKYDTVKGRFQNLTSKGM